MGRKDKCEGVMNNCRNKAVWFDAKGRDMPYPMCDDCFPKLPASLQREYTRK